MIVIYGISDQCDIIYNWYDNFTVIYNLSLPIQIKWQMRFKKEEVTLYDVAIL